MKRILTVVAAVAGLALSVGAAPARKGFFNYTQPDGSSVKVELVGDEYGHYYKTPEGVALVSDAEGRLVPAGLTLSELEAKVSAHSEVLREKQRALREARTATKAQAAAARAEAGGDEKPVQSGMGLFTGDYPRTGKVHGLVFLVEYPNMKFRVPDAHDYFTRMLNEPGFSDNGATGSARDYFLDQSEGKFDVTFDVYGPVTLSQNYAYYGGNDTYGNDLYPERMVLEGAKLLDGEINFADYDYDNNGVVDNIFLIYAGEGEASGGVAQTVWPHAWTIPTAEQITLDGKKIAGYACTNEWEQYLNAVCGIGTVCHEFSHVMGLPDLYSTSASLSCTPWDWCVMDHGSYNNDGRTPAGYSAFERNAMGWLDLTVLDGPATVSLEAINESNHACLIPTDLDNEFFLLENRQQDGWDKYLPYHGMLIWHIDFNQGVWDRNTVNNNSRHQYVDIEEANNNPNGSSLAALRGYAYPGTSRVTSFTSTTTPALRTWAGKGIDLPITDITEANGVISFNVAGGNIELVAPGAPVLEATADGLLTVSWRAVAGADNYRVSIYTKTESGDKVLFGDYTDMSVGNVLSITVQGISGETEYFATVQATRGDSASDVSDEGSVVSPAVDITNIAPTAMTGVRDSDGTAVLSWHVLKEAVKYLLTIEVPTEGVETTLVIDGGTGDEISVPAGWTWSGDVFTSLSAGYFGEAAPAFKFGKTGDCLESPMYGSNITELSYWLRGASASGTSAITVEGRGALDEKWVPLRTVVLINEAKTAKVFTDVINSDVKQVRFSYEKQYGNASLDDVKLRTIATGYAADAANDRRDVGSATSVTVTLPTEGCRFYVEGVDASGKVSLPSNKVLIEAGSSGIDAPEVVEADGPVEYFNLQGQRVERPSNGLYIRRQGGVSTKVLL